MASVAAKVGGFVSSGTADFLSNSTTARLPDWSGAREPTTESKSNMKPRTCLLTVLAAAAAVNALGQTPTIPTNGLVAFYPLDGNADDASSNQSHGIPTALTYQTNRFGFSGAAGSFDGENSRVRVPTTANFNLLPVTATAWVRLHNNAGTDLSIVSTYFTASANGWGIFVNDDFVRSWYYRPQGSVPTGTLTTARLALQSPAVSAPMKSQFNHAGSQVRKVKRRNQSKDKRWTD